MKQIEKREMPLVSAICALVVRQAELFRERKRSTWLSSRYGINPNNIPGDVWLENPENIIIGPNTYMNSGYIIAGKKARVVIGDWCAIGCNVHIRAISHDLRRPTGPNRVIGDGIVERDITIGDHVWIGDNVYIREGTRIGRNAIIGANSVVTDNVEDNAVVGGVPAKLLYFRKVENY